MEKCDNCVTECIYTIMAKYIKTRWKGFHKLMKSGRLNKVVKLVA